MSPCCIAAATTAAVMTALIVIGLTAFVVVTDGFGLGVLLSVSLVIGFQELQWIGPCPRLLYGFSVLLGVRAGWLLATTRRPLLIGVWRAVLPTAAWVVLHLTPLGWARRFGSGGPFLWFRRAGTGRPGNSGDAPFLVVRIGKNREAGVGLRRGGRLG